MNEREQEIMRLFESTEIPLITRLERLALINRLAGETGKSYDELAKELGIGIIEARVYRTFYQYGKQKSKKGVL